MYITPRSGFLGQDDYSGGTDFTAYQDPAQVDYLNPVTQDDGASYWNTPAWAGGTDYTEYQDPSQVQYITSNPGYDTSQFWGGDWFAPSSQPTNNPIPGAAPSGGSGGDVGGILGALKNLFGKHGSSSTSITPAPRQATIAGIPVNVAVIGIAAVAAGVLFLTYKSKRPRRRRRS